MRRTFAGVSLERHRASVIIGAVSEPEKQTVIDTTISEHVITHFSSVGLNAKTDCEQVFWHLASEIRQHCDRLDGLGISAYGPFKSLDYASVVMGENPDGYGHTVKEYSDPPFDGIDIYGEFKKLLDGIWSVDTQIDVQNDAVAGALAEAHFRGQSPNDLLVYLILTDGVGGGSVRGQRPRRTEQPSNIGLVPVQILEEDQFRYHPKDVEEVVSVERLLAIDGLVKRAEKMEIKGIDRSNYIEIGEPAFWKAPAAYVAQLCMSCAVTLGPKTIVVGGPTSNAPNFINLVREAAKRFLETRYKTYHPVAQQIDLLIEPPLVRTVNGTDSCLAGALYLGMLAPSRASKLLAENDSVD